MDASDCELKKQQTLKTRLKFLPNIFFGPTALKFVKKINPINMYVG